jgi:hypothetical protein
MFYLSNFSMILVKLTLYTFTMILSDSYKNFKVNSLKIYGKYILIFI